MRPSRVAGLVSVVSAVICAAVYLSLNDWFGAGDLPAMLVWSLPLGALVAITVGRALPRVSGRSQRARIIVLAAIGVLTGVLWTFAAALILGGWIGSFSFPVLYCWAIGGLLGGLVATRIDSQERTLESSPPAT
jgi:hypothetical protein